MLNLFVLKLFILIFVSLNFFTLSVRVPRVRVCWCLKIDETLKQVQHDVNKLHH
jgi:hypothetical protein